MGWVLVKFFLNPYTILNVKKQLKIASTIDLCNTSVQPKVIVSLHVHEPDSKYSYRIEWNAKDFSFHQKVFPFSIDLRN
ncbi:hypothetical protein XELAEV_18046299mg [Xenopus laevis]|uniref:Uncharacterized protein n=1 Tax=Xenopus laevis TaxID=8355 RepID=A0A974BSW0_XENLA|nr:hypothetical protein XELAEV_18046299mg [Xenopus laevis]